MSQSRSDRYGRKDFRRTLYRSAACLALICAGILNEGLNQSQAVAAAPAGVAPESVELPPHWAVSGRGGMVVSAHPLATEAGLAILRAGGNAIDALLAVQWMLTLVEPQSSGIGGGAFVLYYDASKKKIHAYDGRETAPAAIRSDVFLENGRPVPFYPQRITGGRAVGVPGTPKLMETVFQKHGSGQVSWSRTFSDTIRTAKIGFRVSPRLAQSVSDNKERIALFPSSSRLYLAGGRATRAGRWFRNPELGTTFEILAKHGTGPFYSGELARDIAAAVRGSARHPGSLTENDLTGYKVIERTPVRGTFRGHQIVTMPRPSSGIIMLQALAMLDGYSAEQLNQNTVTGLHLKLEAEKLAFADREAYIADPGFSKFSVAGLLDPGYVALRRTLISTSRSLKAPSSAGSPPGVPKLTARTMSELGLSTTHISIIDANGNVVACTSTIEHGFGSALVVPGRGFLLNNELTDFSATGGINAPAPGKRPRSSMSPTLVFSNDRFVMALGSPGGTFIPGSVSNVLIRALNDGMSLQDAVNAPRLLHRHDARADLEWELYRHPLRLQLEQLGHRIRRPLASNPAFGSVQAVGLGADGTQWGAADPRREARAGTLLPQLRP